MDTPTPNHDFWLILSGSLIALAAAFWSKVKMMASKIFGLAFVRAKLEDELVGALTFYCSRHLSQSPFGLRRFASALHFIRPVKRFQIVGYEDLSYEPTVFWLKWRPLLVTYNAAKAGNEHIPQGCTITYVRGMWSLDDLLLAALDELNAFRTVKSNQINRRYRVEKLYGQGASKYRGRNGSELSDKGNPSAVFANPSEASRERRMLRWKIDELGQCEDGDPWKALAFPKEITELVDEFGHWYNSETWYRERQIPWRMGWLMHGRPGTGKTSIVRALAQQFDMPVMAFDLASFSNDEFSSRWKQLLSNTPCIALLEDIDGVFEGRQNRLGDEGGGLTFDCLLNCLSGIEVADGVFVVITTNNLKAVDAALGLPEEGHGSTRPGRVDRVVELKELDEACRRRIAERILSDCLELVEDTVRAGDGDTGAQFQDRCAKLALQRHWATGHKKNGHVEILPRSQKPMGQPKWIADPISGDFKYAGHAG